MLFPLSQKIKERIYGSDLCSILIEPGPGDALRFVHAFSTKIKQENLQRPLIVITKEAQKSTGKLLEKSNVIGEVVQGERLSRKVEIKVTKKGVTLMVLTGGNNEKILEDFFSSMTSNFQGDEAVTIFHCYEPRYICSDTAEFHIRGKKQFSGVCWKFIDRYDQKKNMKGYLSNFVRFGNKIWDKNDLGVVFFLRFEKIVPERNTPLRLTEELIRRLEGMRVRLKFAGSFPEPGHFSPDIEALIFRNYLFQREKYPNYYGQMEQFSKNFNIAIGVNSGGLDLAIAAGVWGIRIGEFHQCLAKHGPGYNKFLTTSGVINVPSNSETDLSNITVAQCLKAINCFLMVNGKVIGKHFFVWLPKEMRAPCSTREVLVKCSR